MKKIRLIMVGVFVAALVACGGGGSGSGGGTGGGTIFNGTVTIILSAPGVAPVSETGGITITISGGNVTVSVGVDSGTAPLSSDGTKFAVPVKISETDSGVSCNASVIFNGSIAGSKITGPLSGGGSCSGFGNTLPVSVSGNFSATQSGAAKSLNGYGAAETMKLLMHQIQ